MITKKVCHWDFITNTRYVFAYVRNKRLPTIGKSIYFTITTGSCPKSMF